jgi:hypothetical protein
LLIRGNSKLGPEIFHFSIPAGKTCPGETDDCKNACYAKKHFYNMINVIESLERNYQRTLTAEFVAQMVGEIREKRAKIVRIHTSGDFYDAEYIHKWIEIVEQCPNITFFAYTRSWRIFELLLPLRDLAKPANMHLWWSADKESDAIDGIPPLYPAVRIAYMSQDYDEITPDYADLVFRTKRKRVQKYMPAYVDKLVCPAENGTKPKVKMTCSACNLCYKPQLVPWKKRNVTSHAI